MSWTVSVFGGPEPPPIHEPCSDDFKLPVMGSGDEVRRRISEHLPGIDWSTPTWGLYGGNGFTFEFSIGPEEPVDNFAVHVRGGGNAIADLLRFAVPNGWHLLDWSTGDFIDLDAPSSAGWEGWQEYRDKIRRGVVAVEWRRFRSQAVPNCRGTDCFNRGCQPMWRWLLFAYLVSAAGYGGWRGPQLWSDAWVWAFLVPPIAWALVTALRSRGMPAGMRFGAPLVAGGAIGAMAVGLAWGIADLTGRWTEPTVRAAVGVVIGLAGCAMTEVAYRSRSAVSSAADAGGGDRG